MQHERAVEQVQRLKRRRGCCSPRGDLPGIGAIECPESVVELHPRLLLIDHAAKLGWSKHLLRLVNLHIVRVCLEEVEPRSTHPQIELSGDEEHGVPQRLGLEPMGRVTPQQPRLSIGPLPRFRGKRRLPVGRGGHDQPVDMFERPRPQSIAVGCARLLDCRPPGRRHQLRRQIVEQFWVRGLAAVASEVARSIDDSSPEVILPEAIDYDPGGQRIDRIGDPPGESHSTLAFGSSFWDCQLGSDLTQHPGADRLALGGGIAPVQPKCRLRCGKPPDVCFSCAVELGEPFTQVNNLGSEPQSLGTGRAREGGRDCILRFDRQPVVR